MTTRSEDGGSPLREVAGLFLKLGVLGFGGPAAHIALMRDEVVRRRGWINDAEFLDLVGATNLLPGPNSTELAIYLGHRRAGPRGVLAAGFCFIGPAVAIVSVLAWVYQRHRTSTTVVDLRYGVLPVMIAVVVHALVGLSRSAITSVLPAILAVASVGAYLADVHELLILAAAGGASMAWHHRQRLLQGGPNALGLLLVPGLTTGATRRAAASLPELFVVFLQIGSVLYGSGYVLLAFLQQSLVDQRGWLTSQQLLDAVSVGQVTPGPLFTTATFVGWQIHGPAGAAVATVGIFVPSFLFVAFLSRIVTWVRSNPAARTFLDGVTAASLGLMTGVLIDLGRAALIDPYTVAIAAGAAAVLLRTKLSPTWLIGGGLALGALRLVL